MTRSRDLVSEAEAAANRRALSLQRLISNGMEWADAHELHARSERLEPWHAAARDIGDRMQARGGAALDAGHTRTAMESFWYASAAYRFGQNPLPDSDEKREMYTLLIDAYRQGCDLAGGTSHLTFDTDAGALHGWLHLPSPAAMQSAGSPPVVIVLGGFDGWREEYAVGARRLLETGLAVLLLDGPGQGESRLFSKTYMPEDPHVWVRSLSQVVSHLADSTELGAPAVWGNSMGGFLAALLASQDQRLKAVCINGGTDRPAEILDRYPRFISKVQALFDDPDPVTAQQQLEHYQLDAAQLRRTTCPALVLHGEPDQIFLVQSARRLAGALASETTLRVWADGDHCLYNHGFERDSTIADWFADRLTRPNDGRAHERNTS